MPAQVPVDVLLDCHGEPVEYLTQDCRWVPAVGIVRVVTMMDEQPYVYSRATMDVDADLPIAGGATGISVRARGRTWTIQAVETGADEGWRRIHLA